MTKAYNVEFYDINEELTDFCIFYFNEGESLLDRLEEILYIKQELTPVHDRRTTVRMMREKGYCYYTYHNVEFQSVEITNECKIIVKDC